MVWAGSTVEMTSTPDHLHHLPLFPENKADFSTMPVTPDLLGAETHRHDIE